MRGPTATRVVEHLGRADPVDQPHDDRHADEPGSPPGDGLFLAFVRPSNMADEDSHAHPAAPSRRTSSGPLPAAVCQLRRRRTSGLHRHPRLMASGIEVVPLIGPGETMAAVAARAGRRGGRALRLRSPARGRARGSSTRSPRCPATCAAFHAVAAEVDTLIRQRDIDLVLAAMPFSWVAATQTARRHRVPVVWRAGGTVISDLIRPVLRAWASLHPPDLLLCCSEGVRADVRPDASPRRPRWWTTASRPTASVWSTPTRSNTAPASRVWWWGTPPGWRPRSGPRTSSRWRRGSRSAIPTCPSCWRAKAAGGPSART